MVADYCDVHTRGKGITAKYLFWQIFYLRDCFTKCLLCCSQFLWEFFFLWQAKGGKEEGKVMLINLWKGKYDIATTGRATNKLWEFHRRQKCSIQWDSKTLIFSNPCRKIHTDTLLKSQFFQNSSYHFLQCSPSGLSPIFHYNNF